CRPCRLAAGDRACGWRFCPCGRRWPPFRAGPGRGLAVGGRPYIGAGRGWSPLLIFFAAKMQQERVERFYAIQSHHTQFKINLSYENLGSDTTVGKPQRREGGE
ncbi:hypothetical protein B296_00058536, partial [Ensete ventricosum]